MSRLRVKLCCGLSSQTEDKVVDDSSLLGRDAEAAEAI